MSGLVDLWTSEQAKLRHEGGSSPAAPTVDVAEQGRWNSTELTRVWDRVRRLGMNGKMCSEASVCMLVEFMSP
uniref:Uncharacterized protein n=1 Tax=Cucumis sativus TaxID=3659 RepID=A0A0A0LIK6_CUCSA